MNDYECVVGVDVVVDIHCVVVHAHDRVVFNVCVCYHGIALLPLRVFVRVQGVFSLHAIRVAFVQLRCLLE